jgi:hypothetical protein
LTQEEYPRSMPADNETKAKALENLSRSIMSAKLFPKNVFSSDWNEFVFFDSDVMFKSEFPGNVKASLEIESGVCACMANLDQMAQGQDLDQCCLFIDRTMTDEAYQSFLCGSNFSGWIYGVDRFGCISDAGQWAIYCERRNEIAVIAFRERNSLARFASVILQLGALPLQEALEKPLSYGFSPRINSLTSAWRWRRWRNALVKEYAKET